MLSFLKKANKNLLPNDVNEAIVGAICKAELKTSGEIRVYVESKCRFVEPLDRALEVFKTLKMEKTEKRNAVLIYLAIKDKQLAIYGDEGIYEKLGTDFWEKEVAILEDAFKKSKMTNGLIQTIKEVGEALENHFPYYAGNKNELPDSIVFGK